MDKGKFTKGSTQVNVLIFTTVLIMILLVAIALAASAMGLLNNGENAPFFGKATGTGCYLDDNSFADTSTLSSADQVITSIQGEKNKQNISDNKAFVEKIIERSKAKLINPAILIAFWGAEQSFKNSSQAFGCGNKGDGSSGATGEEAEISCALQMIQNAITPDDTSGSSADWSTPKGENIWNRLLYHYVMGSVIQPEGNLNYKNNNYVSTSESPRIKFLSQLVPEQVVCNSGSSTYFNEKDEKANFMTIDKAQMSRWMSAKNSNGPRIRGTMSPSGIVLHYTAGSNVEGAVSTMEQRGSFVHLIIDKNGDVRKLLPFTARVANGSGDGNTFAIGIEIVGMDANDLNSRISVGSKTDPQFEAVIQTIEWLISAYNIPNKRGNPSLLEAHQGIFGHQQVQGKTPMSGCRTAKKDPGSIYLNAIWNRLNSEAVKPICINLE